MSATPGTDERSTRAIQRWKSVPEFTRVTYASSKMDREWRETLSSIGRAWSQIEERSVFAGKREAGLVFVDEKEIPALSERADSFGCGCRVLGRGYRASSYSARAVAVDARGGPVSVRVLIARRLSVDRIATAIANTINPDDVLGGFLGYPSCCRAFFRRAWGQQGLLDVTHATFDGNFAEVKDPLVNSLLRWLGVRPVFHLPCSFHCRPSVTIAEGLSRFAIEQGFGELEQAKSSLLLAPVEWSSNHGIGQVLHPALRVIFSSDWTAERRTIRLGGTALARSPAGERFPYRREGSKIEELNLRRQRSAIATQESAYRDNGFSSESAMTAAHTSLVRLLVGHLRNVGSLECDRVIDLGSGDGTLLQALAGAGVQAGTFVGVEADQGRVARGRIRNRNILHHNEQIHSFILREQQTLTTRTVLVVNPSRFMEMPLATRDEVVTALRESKSQFVFYSYDVATVEELRNTIISAGLRSLVENGRAGVVSVPEALS